MWRQTRRFLTGLLPSGRLEHSTRRQRALPEPLVQVVIPVHQEARPVERAVASVVEPGLVQAIVVAHNLSASVFQARLAQFGADVILIECHDGIHSPAGPLNAGLDRATSPWVTCMGSDDFEQPGAAQAWVAHLRARPADVVILPMLRPVNAEFSIPTIRPGRTQDLDLVQDRLSYRTGPIMLVKRDLLRRYDIRMTDGLKTGEDLNWSLHALAQATHIDLLKPGSPCYVETDDATDRVTAQPYPLIDVLAPAEHLARQTWLHQQPASVRHAIVVRVLRHSVLPAIVRAYVSPGDVPSGGLQHSTRQLGGAEFVSSGRLERSTRQLSVTGTNGLPDRAARMLARRVTAHWAQIDPAWARPMSIAETRAIRALLQPGDSWPGDQLKALNAAAKRGLGARLVRVLPSSPLGMLDSEARPRHLLAKTLNQALFSPRQCGIEGTRERQAGPSRSDDMSQHLTHVKTKTQAGPRRENAHMRLTHSKSETPAGPRTENPHTRFTHSKNETSAAPRRENLSKRQQSQAGDAR